MRKFLVAVVLLLGVYFLLTRLTEVEQVIQTLQRGEARWLALAIALHFAWMVNLAASYRAIYRLLGLKERIERLLLLSAAAYFVNIVAPTAGMGGMAVFVADSRERRQPTGRVTTAVALSVLYDYAGFLVVLALGLMVLIRRDRLGAAEITASLVLIAIALGLGSLIYLGLRSGERLGNALARLGGLVNKVLRPLLRRDYLDLKHAHGFARDVAAGLAQARKSRGGWLMPAALALCKQALLISILFMVFMAFSQPFSVGTLVAGYAIGYLFLIVSPTPSGIGFVEGAMTLALNGLRVPLAAAAVITLAYRGITLWLTLAYGLIAFRLVGQQPMKPETS
jgi:uncharacterized protein (TIRG00374 family)